MINTALFFAFISAILNLACSITDYGLSSLQMDFSSYYTAGESLNAGLSPYVNNIAHTPPIWDGAGIYEHSRFLYPPLVAVLFRPVALIPYFYAKILWTVFSLICVFLAIVVTGKILAFKWTIRTALFAGTLVCLYYPLYTHLERGQVDVLTLLLILLAVGMSLEDKKNELLSGVLLAIATLFKLHCFFLLPFVILRHKWNVLIGYCMGGFCIILLTLALAGPKSISEYVFDEASRIANVGGNGTGSMATRDKEVMSCLRDVPVGMTKKDGVIYKPKAFLFVENATLVRTSVNTMISERFRRAGIKTDNALISVFIFGCLFILVLIWQLSAPIAVLTRRQEFIYWSIAMTTVLLSGPLTWSMNTVWLLPVALLIINDRVWTVGRILCASALILMAIPDAWAVFLGRSVNEKYVIAEIIMLIGLVFMLKRKEIRDGLVR